jgi:hypothetical protein
MVFVLRIPICCQFLELIYQHRSFPSFPRLFQSFAGYGVFPDAAVSHRTGIPWLDCG